MISVTQIHFVEGHWESIARRAIAGIHAEGLHFQAITEQMILDRAQEVFGNLGDYLLDPDLTRIAMHYERIGRTRAHENVALYEIVRCMQIMRQSAVDYLRENELHDSTVHIRSESELEYRIARLFDQLISHLVKGYEAACPERVHAVGSAR